MIRPQDTVGFDLRDELHGVLAIDAQRIPEDQSTATSKLGQVFWRPGPGKEFQELPERYARGDRRVSVATTKTEEDRRDDNEVYSYTWRFPRRLLSQAAGPVVEELANASLVERR